MKFDYRVVLLGCNQIKFKRTTKRIDKVSSDVKLKLNCKRDQEKTLYKGRNL